MKAVVMALEYVDENHLRQLLGLIVDVIRQRGKFQL